MIPAFISPGPMELGVLLLIAVLLFGASKIPELARSSGKAMGEFKKGREQVEEELDEMTGQTDTETQSKTSSEMETDFTSEDSAK